MSQPQSAGLTGSDVDGGEEDGGSRPVALAAAALPSVHSLADVLSVGSDCEAPSVPGC